MEEASGLRKGKGRLPCQTVPGGFPLKDGGQPSAVTELKRSSWSLLCGRKLGYCSMPLLRRERVIGWADLSVKSAIYLLSWANIVHMRRTKKHSNVKWRKR